MRIALVAHGRFHAFDYARELCRLGHDTRLFTNYPVSYVERWGIPRRAVTTFRRHGAASRLVQRVTGLQVERSEQALHEWFGRLAARALCGSSWDAVVCWSGVGEETFRSRAVSGLKICHRSSAHIRVQDQLLESEQRRVGGHVARPTPWMIAREEREYALADRILVPSTFARESFLAQGIDAERVSMVPLGVDGAMFRAPAEVVGERCRRISAGGPLHVAYVGTLSAQKGAADLLEMARRLSPEGFQFHCTGAVAADALEVARHLRAVATVEPAVRQADLPARYARADVFVFPTIQDGFGQVVTQALAAAVPVLCTTHCCGPDLVREGQTGWVLPPRRPDLFVERLRWCQAHRADLASMVRTCHTRFAPRTWAESAAHLAAELSRVLQPAVAGTVDDSDSGHALPIG